MQRADLICRPIYLAACACIAAVLFATLFGFRCTAPQIEKSKSSELLFVGNSHTYVNDLPNMVRQIALSRKQVVNVETIANGGWQLSNHADSAETQKKIQSKKWDFVILQEGGGNAQSSVEQAKKLSYPFALKLNSLIKKSTPNTQVVLYMIQGYQNNYEGTQRQTKINIMNIGKQLRCAVAPCGLAWTEMMGKNKALTCYLSDGYHPSVVGSYISACVIYATIFCDGTSGAFAPQGIDAATARQIQETVDQMMLRDKSPWNVERARAGIPIIGEHVPQ